MKAKQWEQVNNLFHAALEREPDDRADFMDQACAGDEELRKEVESLIASHQQVASFIESPAADLAADLLAERQDKMVGRTVGPYRIVDLLGTGGMGEVYLAEDTRLGREVAIKLLPAQFTEDQDRLNRLKREARAASSLNHPNIITIHEIGQADGAHFIVTEFIEGQTLRQKMAATKMTLPEAFDVAIQTASALERAHKTGIIHRDIKPENLMLRPDGLVKVLDFGLAKLTQTQSLKSFAEAPTLARADTRIGLVMGTVTYMSPEQARGLAVDARSDIFSLGIVMYEMIAGCVPFDGATTSDLIVSILEKEPPPLAQYSPEVPPELERITKKALTKDLERRYQTATNLLIDLKKLKHELELQVSLGADGQAGLKDVAATTVEVQPAVDTDGKAVIKTGEVESARTASGLWKNRSARWRLAIAASALLALSAALVFFFLVMNKRVPTPAERSSNAAMKTIAVLPFKPLVAETRNESLELGMADTLINKLSPIRQLIVRPISAVRKYTSLQQDPLAAGRELRVDYVLEGNLQMEGEKTRATVRLLSVKDGSAIFTDSSDQARSTIFELQDAIAERIAGTLALELTGDEKKQLAKHYTENAEAYRLYNLATYHFRKVTREGYNKSIEYNKQAIEIDPNYAMAYVGLGRAYASLGQRGFLLPKEARQKYEWAALKAVELDDGLAAAHAFLGYVKKNNWDWTGAEKEHKRALELDPNSLDANFLYYSFLRDAGRPDEALPFAKRSQELGGVNSEPAVAVVYLYKRQYDTAIELFLSAIAGNPNGAFAHFRLGESYVAKGLYEKGIEEMQKAVAIDNAPERPDSQPMLAYAYAVAGKRAEAVKILDEQRELAKHQYISPYNFAIIYTGLGDRDRAFDYLEKAYEERSQSALHVKNRPMFDSLRSDPRYPALLRKINLEP